MIMLYVNNNGEIIENIREELIRNKFEDFRIEYLDNKISENKWKSKIARDTINNEKYRSLIEIFEIIFRGLGLLPPYRSCPVPTPAVR